MMRKLNTAIAFALLATCSFCLARPANVKAILVRARSIKHVYHVGERLSIHIGYRNVSPEFIRFLPTAEVYSAGVLSLRDAKGKKVDHFITFAHLGIDNEQLSREVVILRPNQEYHRTVSAQIRSTLPPDYHDKTIGLFLVFRVSAIRLPGFGRYKLAIEYDSISNPTAQYFSRAPNVWEGNSISNWENVEFRR